MSCKSLKSSGTREIAAAEMIGALVLIAIFVVAIGIIAIGWFSQPPPLKVPAIAVSITNHSKIVSIAHESGDIVPLNEISILVNGMPHAYTCTNCGDSWSIGEILTIDYTDHTDFPTQVDLVYKGTSQQLLTSRYLGIMTPTPTQGTVPTTATPLPTVTTATPTSTPTIIPPTVAGFTGTPTSGTRPLTVQFTDTSTNSPTSWNWNFGDDNITGRDLENPAHLYTTAGTYSVTLTATNAGGSNTTTRTAYIQVNKTFSDFVAEDNVFVYGTTLEFAGNNVVGPYATVVIQGPLSTSDLNGGSSLAVNTIYIDGDVTLDGGSAGLGSPTNPGAIYVNGDMDLGDGTRHIYGDVYIAGNFDLKDARIHGKVYVDGDLTLDWTPTLDNSARIYYTGQFKHPKSMDSYIIDRCIKQDTVPGFTMPDEVLPPAKSAEWYASRGYVAGGSLTSNMKVFADSYSSTSWRPTATNVVIIAKSGDITITGLGSSGLTGVLFAPNGKVTFNGGYFEGVVIARNGFFVTSGGSTITFKNLDEYFSSPGDYPF